MEPLKYLQKGIYGEWLFLYFIFRIKWVLKEQYHYRHRHMIIGVKPLIEVGIQHGLKFLNHSPWTTNPYYLSPSGISITQNWQLESVLESVSMFLF